MIRKLSPALAALLLAACCCCQAKKTAAPAPLGERFQPAKYSGGFFTVGMRDNRAWFFAPDGQRFLSQGVNAIGPGGFRAPNPNFYDPVPKQFGNNKQAWVQSVFERLSEWGFNTVGAWSDDALYGQRYPYTYMLYAAGNEHPLDHVFEPGFETLAAQNTEKAGALSHDPYLIGYFLDNELPWWGEFGWRQSGQKTLLERYALASAGGPGKAALRSFFERRYEKNFARFKRVYETSMASFDDLGQPQVLVLRSREARRDADEFAAVVAERYFSVTTRALRERDPNHLQLCVRFAGEAPWSVVQVAAKYCDVISVNQYQQSGNIARGLLDDFYARAHKPILLTEYSFSATENQSGDPNTKGAMVTVATQQERAEHTTRFVTQALALPYIVGLHWFEWADESPQGRFDGEDQNYGLVDLSDHRYALLTEAQQRLNHGAEAKHAASREPLPTTAQAETEASLHASVPPKTLSAPVSFFEAGEKREMATWGDAPKGGSASTEQVPGAALIRYDSGSGWGAGVSFVAASWPFDASGAEHLELALQIPSGTRVQILINEAGAAAPGQNHYAGQAGSDGEAYEFPALVGTGKLETYMVDLHELERRSSWGNQHGAKQLDLQALTTVDLYFAGQQGSGEIRVASIRFTH